MRTDHRTVWTIYAITAAVCAFLIGLGLLLGATGPDYSVQHHIESEPSAMVGGTHRVEIVMQGQHAPVWAWQMVVVYDPGLITFSHVEYDQDDYIAMLLIDRWQDEGATTVTGLPNLGEPLSIPPRGTSVATLVFDVIGSCDKCVPVGLIESWTFDVPEGQNPLAETQVFGTNSPGIEVGDPTYGGPVVTLGGAEGVGR